MESKKKRSTSPLWYLPLPDPTHSICPYSFNLEFVICSLSLLKKHGIFSFCVNLLLAPRPPCFLTRIVKCVRERVTCNWYILVSLSSCFLFLFWPLYLARWYPRTIFTIYLRKKRVKEGGGREGARVSQEQLNTDRRAAQKPTNKNKKD